MLVMNSIKTIIDNIKQLFNGRLRMPVNPINGLLLICGMVRRPGLSTIISVGNIMAEISKNGLPTMNDACGQYTNDFVEVMVGEIVRTFSEDIRIQGAFPTGAFTVVGEAGTVTNTNIVNVDGV